MYSCIRLSVLLSRKSPNSDRIFSFAEPVGPCAIARKLAQETDHLPFCDEDGFFSKEQCSGSECWCCDKCGNELHGTKAAPWEMPSCSKQMFKDYSPSFSVSVALAFHKIQFRLSDGPISTPL